jgi:hypothetical protein
MYSTTSDPFRRLLSQLGSLIEATESNNEISKAIYHEVTTKPGPAVAFENSEDDSSPRNPNRQKGKSLLRMIKSQSQLLQDHKQVLEDVEKAAFSGIGRPDTLRNNINLVSLTEQFVDGISEYQNLVSVLIDSIDNIQHSLRGKIPH